MSAADQHTLDAFHQALGMIPETDEPPAAPAADAPIGWQGKVVQILRTAGADTWMSAGEVRDALAEHGTDLARQTVSTALAKMARRGQIRTQGTGTHTVYAALEHTGR
ncbi:BlaI/MecI/CopY family transcriptional regulator [Catenulispora yoronensis]